MGAWRNKPPYRKAIMRLRDSNGYALCPTITGIDRIQQTNWKQTWIHRKGRSLKDIALQYCAENPEARKQIASKAQPKYEGKPEIKDRILQEEEKYWKLLERGSKMIAQLKQEELTGAKLCELHDTYGLDPTIVEDVLGKDLPQSLHDEYLNERAKLQATSRAAQKKTIIKCADCNSLPRSTFLMMATYNSMIRHEDSATQSKGWCRLVPAEEVEKAWDEGLVTGRKEALTYEPFTRDELWLRSRAKQIAEGKE